MNHRQSKRGRQLQQRMNPRGLSRSEHVAPLEGVYANAAMTHALTTLLGCVVDVQLQSGLVYEGILRVVSPQMDVVLEVAHIKTDFSTLPSKEKVNKTLELKWAQIVSLSAREDANTSMKGKEIFRTDAEISHLNGPAAIKELQPFTDFEEGSGGLSLDTVEHSGWGVEEMWTTNKEKFNVTSSFDEKMSEYTTDLTCSDQEEFKQRELRAARLALEIESQNRDRHGVDDTGTEEEVFSAVVRPPAMVAPPSLPQVAPPSLPQVSETCRSLHVPHEENGESTVTMATETSESGGVEEGEMVTSEPLSEPPMSSGEGCQNEESLPPRTDAQETVDMDLGHSTTSSIPEESEEDSPQTTSDPNKKEEAIRKFKLDPNAKEFSPLTFDTPTTASAVTTRASPSPTVSSISSSSLRSSPSALHFPSGGSGRPRYKSPRPHSHTPTTFLPQDSIILTSTPASAGYIVTQPVSSGIVRPLAQVPSRPMMYGSPQYAHIPAGSTFMATPQVVSPKFDHLSAQPQVIVAGQQLPLINQPQMYPGQGSVLPASQAQAMMSIPQQQMMYMPGMPLQPTMAMPTVAGGFVQGHPTAFPQNRTVPYTHQQHTTGK